MKRIVIFTMGHISEFQKTLDSSYTRIGLLIYVKFSLGKIKASLSFYYLFREQQALYTAIQKTLRTQT